MIDIPNIDSGVKKDIFFIIENYRKGNLLKTFIKKGIKLHKKNLSIEKGIELHLKEISVKKGYILKTRKINIKKGIYIPNVMKNISNDNEKKINIEQIKYNNSIFNKEYIVYKKGMTIREFLKQNPNKRLEEDVLEYFSIDEIQESLKKCKIFKKHGKLII